MPLAELSCPISKYAFLDTNFSVVHGFVGFPGQDLLLGSRAVPLQSLKLWLGWKTSIATTSFLDAALVTLQTMRGATHMSRSC